MSVDSTIASEPSRRRRSPGGTGTWAGWFASSAPATAAAIAVAVAGLVLWCWRSAAQIPAGGFWSGWAVQALDLGLALLVGVALATVVTVGCRLAGRRPSWWLLWSAVSTGFLVGTMGGGASVVGWLLVAGLLLVAVGVGAAAVAAQPTGTTAARRRPRLTRSAAGPAALVIALVVGFLVWPGGSASPVTLPASSGGVRPLPASAAGPDMSGGGVIETRYGAGRPGPDAEYGPGVPIVTRPVDASRIIGGWSAGSTRSGVWGFDASSLPLNGIVWTPAGAGPFPLVVLVHGNSAFDHSERGLAYLGRSLAARGYAAVSIDENFLSTSIFDKSDPISGANPARAWLILEHVRQFVEWNSTAGSAFQGKIDVSRISLVGHSRGGEAVAVAAAFNTMPSLPEDPSVTFAFGFALRAVVALAPSDGQYLPGGQPVTLGGLDYLTVAGTMDADVGTFAGERQYARVATDDGHVAAAVAIHRANHTQFNSDWGRSDVGLGAAAQLLATGPLLGPDDQRRAAAGLVGAFLDLTVGGRSDYRGLFDGTAATPEWLPDTVYVRRFTAGDGTGLARFDRGDSIDNPWGRATVTGGTGRVVGLPTKAGPSTDRVLQVTADADQMSYTVSGLDAGRVAAGAVVTVDAGTDSGAVGIGVAVRASDVSGASVTVALLPWAGLPAELDSRTLKPLLPGSAGDEVLLQTFSVPVSVLADQGLDPAQISQLSVVVDGAAGHQVYLDDVGVR